jgi:hypothetical protein
MKLPSGLTTEELRQRCELDIANDMPSTTVRAVDLLALLVAMDLRERLDKDVELCATFAWAQINSDDPNAFNDAAVSEASARVLKHEPGPDMSKAPS